MRAGTPQITRADLEQAFSRLLGDGEQAVQRTLPPVLAIAGAAALAVATIAYLAGRRKGRRMSAVVQIRRL